MTILSRQHLPKRISVLVAFVLITVILAGCGNSSTVASHSGPSSTNAAAIQRAQHDIIAVCAAVTNTASRAAGGANTLQKAVTTLIDEARMYHNPAIIQGPDAALRAGASGKECGPSYADTMDIALLQVTARATVKKAGFPGFRPEDESYYATHYGANQSVFQRECVTKAGEFSENVEALENFLYLLNVGNSDARHLLITLQHECINDEF